MKYKDENGNWQSISVKVADTLPLGAIVLFGGTNAPTGWLICDGSAISRTTYSKLFSAIGTSYGEGDGSTTFNLPNYKGKVAVGLDPGDKDFNTLGKIDGEKAHQLTINEIPSHNHCINRCINGNNGSYNNLKKMQASADDGSWQEEAYTSNSGENYYHNNLQPYLVSNYIIKAEESVANTSTNENVYSEEEVIIGKYMGKTLYRKSIIIDGNQESVPHNINNLNEVIKYHGNLYRIESVIKSQILPHTDINQLFIADVNYFSETTVEMIFGDSIKNKIVGFNLTLEYTKTTD